MSLVSGALLITLIIFSLSVFYFVNQVESAAWHGRQGEAARNAAGTVSGFIQRVQDALVVISIVSPDQLALESDELIALLQKNTAILEIIHTDRAGKVIASAARDKSILANLITIPQSQWYLQAKQGRTYIGDVQLSASDMPYLIMAIPGADKGVVAARIQMDILWTVVNNIQFGESGEVIVITQTGNIIAHTNPEFVLSRQTLYGRPEFSAILNAPDNIWSGVYKDFHNQPVVAATTRIPATDWIVITELSQPEAYFYSRIAIYVLGAEAFLLLLAASFIVARFVQSLITRPMEQLIIGAERVGQGDLSHRINMIRKNEIGQAASAFDAMAASLQEQQLEVNRQTTALQSSEANLRRIADNMYDIITQIGPDGIIQYSSSSVKRVLGIEAADLFGEMIFERIHPDDMAKGLEIFSQAVADRVRPQPFALRYKHANGKYVWMECAASILTDPNGEFAGAVLSSRDISERKKMEMELSASEQRYRILAENASDVIWAADMNMQMNYVSPAVEKLFGYTVEESLTKDVFQSMTPESAQFALSFFAQILMELKTEPKEPLRGASRSLELEWVRKDGSTVWTEAKVSFMLDDQDKPVGLLGVTRDISERRLAEEARQKALAYEYESQRARELDILLKASEATSSSLDFHIVLHTLASQLLELSGFESCFISEWDKETNSVIGRLDDSRTFWREDLRDSYSMSDYPQSNQVLLTGSPIILQGDFEAEEKQWMNQLKRTAVIVLAIYSRERIIGLAEIATTKKNKLFTPQDLLNCQEILTNAAPFIKEPLSVNEPRELFEIERALLQACGGEVCSFSEWDEPDNKIFNLAVSSHITWDTGEGTRFNPDLDTWRQALDEGKTITFQRSKQTSIEAVVFDGVERMNVESLIIFPLQKGTERIGVIELYDFNHEIQVTPEQITLLKTIADKASYSIENARLLQLTQNKLDEQTELLNEKEVLLKEIHHRVKNNLQIISSLLNLQSDQIKDTGTLRVLRDSQARVRSMALIHEKLYQSKSLAKINFGEYVQSLSRDLFRSYQRSLGDIKLNVQVDEVSLDLDYAVPCGLILNELMTNALKYAFPNRRNGSILVELRVGPNQTLSLMVADDGVGLPPGLDILKNKSLGLQLIDSLVKQIDGNLQVEKSMGTSFQISFKA